MHLFFFLHLLFFYTISIFLTYDRHTKLHTEWWTSQITKPAYKRFLSSGSVSQKIQQDWMHAQEEILLNCWHFRYTYTCPFSPLLFTFDYVAQVRRLKSLYILWGSVFRYRFRVSWVVDMTSVYIVESTSSTFTERKIYSDALVIAYIDGSIVIQK